MGPSEGGDRAARVLATLDVTEPAGPLGQGESNDTWATASLVLRIARSRGDAGLLTEGRVLRALPAEVGAPTVVASGEEDGFPWLLTSRLPGENLHQAWTGLYRDGRETAVRDLFGRLEAVHATPLDRLPRLPPSPIYALNPGLAVTRLARASTVVGPTATVVLRQILDRGWSAIRAAPVGLVHTDAGAHNAVWDGTDAVPVDFEFATRGPVDLDLDQLGRWLAGDPDHDQLALLRELAAEHLARPGSAERLRAYTVLHELWVLGKWLAPGTGRDDVDHWAPVQALRSHLYGTSWVDRFLR